MKLSEAIRFGAMSHPQCFDGELFEFDGNGEVISTCALGGAALAIGIVTTRFAWTGQDLYNMMTSRFPALALEASCPCGSECREFESFANVDMDQVIWHLNDDHEWSREQIADWVATIEPEPEPVEPLVALEAVRA